MIEPEITKTCTKCKETKPISDFYKDKTGKDGVTAECKACFALRQKYYYKQNRDKEVGRVKAWRKQNREKISTEKKAYYKQNRDILLARAKDWRKQNREKIVAIDKAYHKTEAGKNVKKKANHKRRALKLGATVEDFSPKDVFERDRYICQICGCKTRPDYKNQYHPKYPNLDHLVPLSKGGEHSKCNTQCLCRKCNMEKKANEHFGDQVRMFG